MQVYEEFSAQILKHSKYEQVPFEKHIHKPDLDVLSPTKIA